MRIERVVSIASPLITLFKSGQSALLPALFRSVLVPDRAARRAAYRDLFGSALDDVPLSELRMALNQDEPAGNDRFYGEIESMPGQRRELRKRGRPRKSKEGELPLN
jgi:hypothetical protein